MTHLAWTIAVLVLGIPIVIRCIRVHRLRSTRPRLIGDPGALVEDALAAVGRHDVAVVPDPSSIEPSLDADGRALRLPPLHEPTAADLAAMLRLVGHAARRTRPHWAMRTLAAATMTAGMVAPLALAGAAATGRDQAHGAWLLGSGFGLAGFGACAAVIIHRREHGLVAAAEPALDAVVAEDGRQMVREALRHRATRDALGLSWFIVESTAARSAT